VAWVRSASRATGASLEAAIVWRDWLGAGARLEVVRGEPSLHGTVRLGSYLGLAVGGTSVLLVPLLQNVAFTS
jgi:hypothetical protein